MAWIQMLGCLLLFASSGACQDLDVPLPPPADAGERTFSELEVSAGVWEVRCRNGSDFGALGTGFGMTMHLAQLTVDAGHEYYHAAEPRWLADDLLAVRMQTWAEPPDGAHVVRWDDPATLEGMSTAEFVVTHAASWLAQYDRDTMRENVQLTKRRREELMSTRTVEVDELGIERRPFAPDAEFAGVRTLALARGAHDWPAPLLVGETWRLSWL